MTTKKAVLIIGIVALVTQVTSAYLIKSTASPNAATRIAKSLSHGEGYTISAWHRLAGEHVQDKVLNMWHLPGEPLYLALGFRLAPESAHRILHVPVTVALILAVVLFATFVFGPRVGFAAGLVAVFQPFVIVHGPVWDDAFLGGAAYWLVIALTTYAISRGVSAKSLVVVMMSCMLLAALGGLTRSQVAVGLVGFCLISMLTLRSRQAVMTGSATILGVVLALGAWGYRNMEVSGHFFTGSSHDGITLWESNYPHAWEAAQLGQVEALNKVYMQEHFLEASTMTEWQANRYYKELAVDYLRRNPLQAALSSTKKLLVSTVGIAPQQPLTSMRNMTAMVGSAFLFVGAIFGIVAAARDMRMRAPYFWLHAAWLATLVFGMLAIGPIGLRYRLLIDGFLWTLCGLGLVSVFDRLRSTRIDQRL